MSILPTLGLLSIADGRLMGDIGDVYEVISLFIGRPAYTHELPMFADKLRPLIISRFPNMAGHKAKPWAEVRDATVALYGATVEVPDDWAGAAKEDRGPIETIVEAVARARRQ